MECRALDIMILSAKGLKYVKHFSKMDVYAVVKISGVPNSEQKTNVDKDGGGNPTWNFPVQFTIDEASARRNNQVLIFQLRCDRTVRGDKDIGEVQVPLKELLDNTVDGKSTKVVSYQVKQPSGKPKGELKFSYKFGDRVMGAGATNQLITPVTAYPAHTMASYPPAGYPPLGQPLGHPPVGYTPIGHPPAGYPIPTSVVEHGCHPYVGYPPSVVPSALGNPSPVPQYGYQVVQPERKNELEFELGAALAGVIGALLVGDLVVDAAADHDAGLAADYDAGLDNGASFQG